MKTRRILYRWAFFVAYISVIRVLLMLLVVFLVSPVGGASVRTPNFIASAPTQAFAEQVARAAEGYRRDLAVEWLGDELPQWSQPCPISVHVVGDNGGNGGQTSFIFDHGEVVRWNMHVRGSQREIITSVLPHEVTHTIFASHFRRPLPRWADEGACTTVENDGVLSQYDERVVEFLRTRRSIAFSRMFAMYQYPSDVAPLYAQGYSLARYLIAQSEDTTTGRRHFVAYLHDGLDGNRWVEATEKHYGTDIAGLQNDWVKWVAMQPCAGGNGSPGQQQMVSQPQRRPPGYTYITPPPTKPPQVTPSAPSSGVVTDDELAAAIAEINVQITNIQNQATVDVDAIVAAVLAQLPGNDVNPDEITKAVIAKLPTIVMEVHHKDDTITTREESFVDEYGNPKSPTFKLRLPSQ